MEIRFSGYRRPDGTVGVRNHLLVVPSVICANQVCSRIAEEVPGAVAIPHQHGCSQVRPDAELTYRVLAAFGRHPNVGAVLVVSLGCEVLDAPQLAQEVAVTGRPAEWLRIQDVGGSVKAIAKGVRIASGMMADLRRVRRQPVPASQLLLGLKCGAVDASVWEAANPVLGQAVDRHLDGGGSALFGETAELAGCPELPQHWPPAVKAEVVARLQAYRRITSRPILETGEDLLLPVSGAGAGAQGLLQGAAPEPADCGGALAKAGRHPLAGVLPYGGRPDGPGLWFVDTPVADVPGLAGLLAGGAQIVVFNTGRGTPVGSPIAPVIKVTANPDTADRWRDHIDLDLGRHAAADPEAAHRLLARCLAVAGGEETKAEVLGHQEFSIHRVGISL